MKLKLNVLQKFTLLSIGATVGVVVILSLLVSGILTRWLIGHEARITAEAIRTVTSIDLPPEEFERVVREEENARFEYIWSHLRQIPEVFRVKVYDRHGRIVWSDEQKLIDRVYEDNEELDEALEGRVVVETGELKEEHEFERPLAPEREILEIYAPLIDAADGTVYAVFEVYKHPVSFFRSRDRLLAVVWAGGAGGGAVLFLSLFWMFRRALLEQRRLQEVEKEYADIELELKVAQRIQKRLLPAELPDVPGFALTAYHQPSREIGGDYFDAFRTEDGHLMLVIADGEGKGIPGALVIAETRQLLRVHAGTRSGTNAALEAVNKSLAGTAGPAQIVTALLAGLDAAAGALTYCSAGHCPALLFHHGRIEELDVGGPALGMDPSARYVEGSVRLSPGDAVLLYTDGVTEADGPGGDMFGAARLRDVFGRSAAEGSAQGILDDINAALAEFIAGRPRGDDTTMVCLCVRP